VFGRLSNHLGRRLVSIAALLVTACGCLVLTDVHGPGPLILGRILQGIGAGLASSAIAAYIVDSAPRSPRWLAAAVMTGAPMVGLTVGALGSGALVQYAPHPRSLVYLIARRCSGCAPCSSPSAAIPSSAPEAPPRRSGRNCACRLRHGACSPLQARRSSQRGRSAASKRSGQPLPPTNSARATRSENPDGGETRFT
jgi:MFS family permease